MADAARARKIAERIKAIVAEQLEYRVKDERLGFVTVTDVRVTGDLQHATVFYTVFGSDEERANTAKALESAKGKIRSALGQLGIRLTPSIDFVADALPEGAAHLEDLLVATKARDEEIAKAAAGAVYAGEADPYRKPGESDDDESEDDADDSEDDPEGSGDDADEPASERE
ncbi:MAG TPA: 30S ribosome-binding factor RbfA [Dermatophilaceae bacterium]|uniref:Ribosome-binding factor A n=1 Tax=Candidatus Phosphoribacter hodrii TaxID=2953743 RepID=A0A935CCT4_9MICO|nr:30S ribosome-binding factor RbfA [Candidatus Phosphoribacter hodrii]HRC64317.1 30S ribosome-binding factor RbfA [Dermatophilaceae bacterium]